MVLISISKNMPSTFIRNLTIILFLLCLTTSQILVPRCNICQRCTFCSNDVMYDCDIDSIYAAILRNNPEISSAFPVRITKNVNSSRTTYFFQFSNNKNITYQIIRRSNTIENMTSNTQTAPSDMRVSNSNSSISSSNFSNQTSTGNTSQQITWTPLPNVAQIILQYVIRHFHLSRSTILTSLEQQTRENTYTAVVRSADSSIRMSIFVNPKDSTLKVSSISFLSGSIDNLQNNTNSPPKTNPPTSPRTQTRSHNPTQRQGIALGNGVSISSTLQQLLDYLFISYSALGGFQLDSFSTTDNVNYNLTLSNRQQPSISYSIQALVLVPISGNLRGMGPPSRAFQIMSYSLINTTTPSSFTPLITPQQIYADPFAREVMAQMQAKIIRPLSLKNLLLVNISSSVPFYGLVYEMETQVFRFLVSYDVLTQQVRIIEESITDKNNRRNGSASRQNTVAVDEVTLTPVRRVQNNNTSTSQSRNNVRISRNTTSSTLNQNSTIPQNPPRQTTPTNPVTPSIPQRSDIKASPPSTPTTVPLVQVREAPPPTPTITSTPNPAPNLTPTATSPPIFINYRIDPVFVRASSAINSIYPFKISSIVKVSVITLSNIMNQYSITLNFNLPSGRLLQFTANYNSATNNVTFNNFTYTPQNALSPSSFQLFPLSQIGKNPLIMSLVSNIFMSYPQYFSNAVSSIQSVHTFPPYFNITYSNSVFGTIRFDSEFNYLTNTSKIINFVNTQPASNNSSSVSSAQKAYATNVPIQDEQSQQNSDLFCIKHSKGICTQCAFRFFYDKTKKKCISIQDQCNTFDYTNSICTSCFSGYALVSGTCQLQ